MNEQRLFIAVLVQGMTDALNKFRWSNRLNSKYQLEAQEWLGSKDFNLICSYAQCQPHEIIKMYKDISKHKHYLTLEDIKYLLNETFNRRFVL
ncbi:hypothetical protein [uncultured Mediterranean phage]|nr:hypothetical protein [uncultured Mediterranean phage]